MDIDFFKEEKIIRGRSIPEKIILGAAISGFAVIMLGLLVYAYLSAEEGIVIMMLGFLIGVLPYSIISFFKNRALKQIENQFPAFLNDLAESQRGGMTIQNSLESARETDYGRLNKEIGKIHNQLSWGIPFPQVLERFSQRMEDSSLIQQSVSIILQGFRSGGNITETIQSVAEDASKLRDVLQEKDSKLKQQLFIIYIIYFLFVGISVGTYFMMGELLGLGTEEEGAVIGMTEILGDEDQEVARFCGQDITPAGPLCTSAHIFNFVPQNVSELGYNDVWVQEYGYAQMAYYKSLLFLILIVQGISISALAGQITEGKPSAGIKHALILLPAAFIIYMWFVAPAGVV